MVINLQRKRRWRADEQGNRWQVGQYRKDMKGARRYRCFLNGQEVTTSTFYVDSRRGVVRMYLRNAEGCLYVQPGTDQPAWIERRGRVRLRRRKDVAA